MSKNIFKNIFLLVHPFALYLWSFSSLRPFGGGSNLVVRPPYFIKLVSNIFFGIYVCILYFSTAYIHFTFSIYHLTTSKKNAHKISESFWHRHESMCHQSSVVVPVLDVTHTSGCITVEEMKVKSKFALLLGEAQLCLPYVCL